MMSLEATFATALVDGSEKTVKVMCKSFCVYELFFFPIFQSIYSFSFCQNFIRVQLFIAVSRPYTKSSSNCLLFTS